jgi:hypothetical protein
MQPDGLYGRSDLLSERSDQGQICLVERIIAAPPGNSQAADRLAMEDQRSAVHSTCWLAVLGRQPKVTCPVGQVDRHERHPQRLGDLLSRSRQQVGGQQH